VIRFSARILYLIAFIFPCASLFAQTEFSAEIVDTQKSDTPTQAKVYFAKDKLRIESQEHNSRGQGVFIMNFATQTSDVLMTQQHMYMEMPAQVMNQRGLYSFFQTGDVENACSDWLKMERNAGGSCHKVGNETVNGRSAVKYAGTNSSGEPSSVWLDPKLRFPVKWQGKSSAGELRNIQEGTQSASLFEIPAGYTKMDIGHMMQQHSQQQH
jgi:outer membrane lipoprotein-sorting protein